MSNSSDEHEDVNNSSSSSSSDEGDNNRHDEESSSSNSSSSDGGSDNEDTEGLGKNNSGLGGGGGFADALQKILKKPLDAKSPGSAILSKRKTPNMKLIEKELEEERERKKARATKKDKDMIGLEIPTYKTMNYERQLKRIATRGVVSLFNAVKAAQTVRDNAGSTSSSSKSDKNLSKDKFFDMLSQGTKGNSGSNSDNNNNNNNNNNSSNSRKSTDEGGDNIAKKNKTDWLDDKFMIGAKMRNWDRDSDNSDDDAQEIEME